LKHRLVFILLLLFAAWPLVHYGLVQRYQLDAWKYGGWAMYVVPARNPELRASIRVEDEWQPLDVERMDDVLRGEALRFAHKRRVQSFRVEPSDLGRVILERHAEVQETRITVDDFKIDPETGRVQLQTFVYDYAR